MSSRFYYSIIIMIYSKKNKKEKFEQVSAHAGRPVKCKTYDRQDDGGTEGFDISPAASLHFLWQDEEDAYLSQGGRNKDADLRSR